VKEVLERLKGKFIKCVYNDGDHVTVAKGKLVSIFDDFIEIHSYDNLFLIRISEIVKVQSALNQNESKCISSK